MMGCPQKMYGPRIDGSGEGAEGDASLQKHRHRPRTIARSVEKFAYGLCPKPTSEFLPARVCQLLQKLTRPLLALVFPEKAR